MQKLPQLLDEVHRLIERRKFRFVLTGSSARNRGLGYELFFWRTHDHREVDLVLYGERGLHAFEVTRSAIFREADLSGLRLFCEDYPAARGHLLYGGTQRYRFGSIDVLPVGPALAELPALLA